LRAIFSVGVLLEGLLAGLFEFGSVCDGLHRKRTSKVMMRTVDLKTHLHNMKASGGLSRDMPLSRSWKRALKVPKISAHPSQALN
jgi:hypothetical protein